MNKLFAWHRNGQLTGKGGQYNANSNRVYLDEGRAKAALKTSRLKDKEDIEIVEYMPVSEARETIAELVAIYDRLRAGDPDEFDELNVQEICSPFTFNIKREEE